MTKILPDRRLFLITVSALGLSACGGNLIGPPAAPQIYVLKPQTAPAPAALGPKVDWALAILRPDSSEALDSERIALSKSDTQLDYYANAVWPDNLASLIQTALLAGFEATGRIASVARDEDSMHADYNLSTDLRDFEARYTTPDGAPGVTVTIVAQMAESHSRKIVANLTASDSEPASANNVDAVVQAFDIALGKVIVQITQWALALPPPQPQTGAADISEPTPRRPVRTRGPLSPPPANAPGAQEVPVPGSATPPAP